MKRKSEITNLHEEASRAVSGAVDGSVTGFEREVASTREQVEVMVDELDRRVDTALDLRHHWRRQWPLLLAGGAAAAGLAGGMVWVYRKRQRTEGFFTRASRLNLALQRAAQNPERVAPVAPTIGGRVLTAALSTAATLLVKQIFKRIPVPRAAEA